MLCTSEGDRDRGARELSLGGAVWICAFLAGEESARLWGIGGEPDMRHKEEDEAVLAPQPRLSGVSSSSSSSSLSDPSEDET